ncbi:SMP-30/gluconolactonase/LRE family protein, partial [Sinomonas humi]
MSVTAAVANDEIHILGEGPFWDPIRSCLLWVDIVRGIVFEGALHPAGRIEITGWHHFGETTGAVAVSAQGDWLVAGQDSLICRDPAGNVRRYPPLPTVGGKQRLNEGKPDPAGRYLIGTLCLEGPSTTETLLQVDHDGGVRAVDEDLTLSNGLAWSPDGSQLYSIDTNRRLVFRRSYGANTGATGPREEFLAFSEGYPDGVTIDAEGHLWIAMWGLGEVRRYSPDGELTESVSVP